MFALTRRRMLMAAALPWLGHAKAAADFPSRPIRLVVPYPAGGPTDTMARILAEGFRRHLGTVSVVVNQPGASGMIGTRTVAAAEPDGHTLLLGNNQTHGSNVLLMKEPGYDAFRDFTPVVGIATLQHILVTRQDHAAGSLAELIRKGRQTPLTFGSTGNGSASHLALELFRSSTGVQITHVAYRGSAQVLPDLMGGRLDGWFSTLPGVVSQIRAGALKALAVASGSRAPQLPDVPTAAEQGIANCEADAWSGLFVPARTPAAILEKLSDAANATLGSASSGTTLKEAGFLPKLVQSGAMAAFMKEDLERWREVVRVANVKAE